MLVFDVSNSMLADDIDPTRIAAAQDAAKAFVEAQPSTIEIGVVAFGHGALVTQVPTGEHADVLAAIDRLAPGGGTSLGQGILARDERDRRQADRRCPIRTQPVTAEDAATSGRRRSCCSPTARTPAGPTRSPPPSSPRRRRARLDDRDRQPRRCGDRESTATRSPLRSTSRPADRRRRDDRRHLRRPTTRDGSSRSIDPSTCASRPTKSKTEITALVAARAVALMMAGGAADDAMVREDHLMSFTWPWALPRSCRTAHAGHPLADAAAPPAIRRPGFERAADPRRDPPARPLEAASAAGAVRRRPAPSAWAPPGRPPTRRARQLHLDPARPRCVQLDVLHRRGPEPLVVAKEAARTFIKAQDNGTRIGIVAFAGIAALVVPPTTNDEPLLDAIDNLTTSRGTAIGMAILASIDAIAEINPHVAPTGVDLQRRRRASRRADPSTHSASFEPDTIVVLTDGANTEGSNLSSPPNRPRHDTSACTRSASARPSRPSRSAPSTRSAATSAATVNSTAASGGGGGGGAAGRRFLEIDEPTLRGRRHDRWCILPGPRRRATRRHLPRSAEPGRRARRSS